ncbi:MAG TPA: TetR family transcriptional regulator [Deltaproteobacteria bacterium]|nr:TetR family transcriptional regulator [Deltaproteobacteria bacterium]
MTSSKSRVKVASVARPRRTVDQSGRVVGPRGLQTRDQLLDALAALMAQRSVREIRVVDVARSVSTSPATFYQYFEDVDEAVLRLAERASARMPQILALMGRSWRGKRGFETAHAIVEAFIRHWDAHHAVLRLSNLRSDEGDRRFLKLRRDTMTPVLQAIAKLIEEGQRAGRVSKRMHPIAAAAALAAILERLAAYHRSLEGLGVTREHLVETSASILYQIVTGRRAP